MDSQAVERWFEPELYNAAAVRMFVRDRTAPLAVNHAAVLLMASELANNAIIHARTPFCVRLHPTPTALRVEVLDRSGDRPLLRPPDTSAPSGRGLRIVRALASAWGVDPAPEGKRVWFEAPFSPS